MSEPVYCGAAWLLPGSVRTFSGRIERGQCWLEFRVQGHGELRRALIDTGHSDVTLSRDLVLACGMQPSFADGYRVESIGRVVRPVATCRATLLFSPRRGDDLAVTDSFLVDDVDPRMGAILGMALLSRGVLTVDGPAGEWEWRVKSPG